MSLLEVRNISRREGEVDMVKDICFSQAHQQNIAIAGATGSGKTTLLKMIAGLVQPTTGVILFDDKKVLGPDEKLIPGHTSIAYLSQHFELRNHYRVKDLLSLQSKLSESESSSIYELCRVDHLLTRWTHELSGGEKQRIALAGTLIKAPKLLLLDEPYSNLDPIHKSVLKSIMQDISRITKLTCILVSHDPIDTLSWADQILVLDRGEMIQYGTPKEVYHAPVSEYAASLFGQYNVMSPTLAKAFSEIVDMPMNLLGSIIRPEMFSLNKTGVGLKALVQATRFIGAYYEVELTVANTRLIVNGDQYYQPKEEVFISLKE